MCARSSSLFNDEEESKKNIEIPFPLTHNMIRNEKLYLCIILLLFLVFLNSIFDG